jgi:Protein of unknown function (DUF3800)
MISDFLNFQLIATIGVSMFRVFLDGSRYEQEPRTLCLGCVVAPDTVWSDFNSKWIATLETFELKSFHMTDAMAGRGAFERWKKDRVDDLLKALTNVITSFFDRDLRVKTCLIDMAAYEKAQKELPKLKDPEAICIDFCCGTPIQLGESSTLTETQPDLFFCFDQNENFMKFFDSAWRKRRKKKYKGGWPQQVKEVRKASSSVEPGLQAADLIAWSTNAASRGIERAYVHAFLNILMGMRLHFDYERIHEEYARGRIQWRDKH